MVGARSGARWVAALLLAAVPGGPATAPAESPAMLRYGAPPVDGADG